MALPSPGRLLALAGRVSEHPAVLAAVLALLASLPLVASPILLRIAVLILVYYVMAVGYNAIITDAGQFHLGYIAFFALGAYTVALMMRYWDTSFWTALAAGVAITIVLGYLVAVPTLRFAGDYLSLVSLAFAEILRLVLVNWRGLTRGYVGVPGIKPPVLFGFELSSITAYYFLILLIAVGGYLSARMLRHSRVGLVWSGICQNEPAVSSVGADTTLYKQLALGYGGVLGALAGGFFASFQTVVDPGIASFEGTLLVLTIVILGGGNLLGMLSASAVLIALPEALRVFSIYRMLILGVFLVAIMNLRPEGFGTGAVRHFRGSDAKPRPKAASDERSAETGPEPILEVVGLTRRFGGLVAVQDVSFGVCRGQIKGIIGPNGAGKTTILNVIAGVIQPSSGDVLLSGRSVRGWPVHRIARAGVGRTFQNLALWEKMTLLDAVMLARVPRSRLVEARSALEDDLRLVEELLDFVGLWARRDDLVKSLPFGDRRRLELARALATSPRLLLLDEISAGMVPSEVEWLVGILRQVRERGVTLLLIEHNMNVITALADDVVVLDHGVKIAEGPPAVVLTDDRVVAAYLGRRAAARLRARAAE